MNKERKPMVVKSGGSRVVEKADQEKAASKKTASKKRSKSKQR